MNTAIISKISVYIYACDWWKNRTMMHRENQLANHIAFEMNIRTLIVWYSYPLIVPVPLTLSPSITIAVSLMSSFSVSFGALKSIDGLHSSIQHSLASFTAPNCSVIDLNSCLSDIQMAMFMDTTNVPHKKHPKDTLHLTHSIFFGVGVFVCSHPTQNKHMFGYSRAVNVLFVLSILYIFILPICT